MSQVPSVKMEISVLPVVDYALAHNGMRIVQSVTLTNCSDVPLSALTLQISSVPAFVTPLTQHIDLLPAGQSIALSQLQLRPNGEYLSGLTEKTGGFLQISLIQETQLLAEQSTEISVLAFDQWHGFQVYPELLCAFVTPNHPHIAGLLARATAYLGQWTGDTSMDAYQSQDPNRVLSQAAAIFAVIKEQAIAYAVAPASFEESGQRIRLCDALLQQKLGTCLDLTLLYAACLEAAGLHPLLISTPGHIFTGVWLEDRMFPECVQDDASLLTKRLASGMQEIAVIETTLVTSGKDATFDQARAAAEHQLTTGDLEYILDVRRARLSHVIPLPQRIPTEYGWKLEQSFAHPEETLTAPQKLEPAVQLDNRQKEETIPKKVQWERKLLDLGLRNSLISLRLTRNQLPILTGSLDDLENALADGSDFSILPRPADWTSGEFTFESLHDTGRTGIIQAEFENKRLRSVLTEAELSRSMKELYRSARTAMEENGANTLYLALGMLRWYETPRSTRARYAPVILIPIEMVRKSAAQGYVIRLRDEEPQMNVTLLEKLKQDFGILVSGTDPLPTDEHGIDIRKVLTILRKAVMEQNRWDVLEAACIGIFSFSQFVMWNDIRNRTEDLMRNKIVRSLIDGKLAWQASPLEPGQKVCEDNVLLPMSADASQLYAIQTACADQSFVLHGPPGTGKSQTITSLIANALANGKRVLFVAEKMAALEVVQKRLNKIGIGPFCLELHSNKSKKRDVLEQLRLATEVTKTVSAANHEAKAQQLSQMRAELDRYAQQLHRPLPCGSTLHTLINAYEACKDAPGLPPFPTDFLQQLDAAALEQHRLLLERLVTAAREVGHPQNHPLLPVGCTQYTQSLRTQLQSTVHTYMQQLQTLIPSVRDLTALLNLPLPNGPEMLQTLMETVRNLVCWYEMPRAWTQAPFPQQYFQQLQQLVAHAQKAGALSAQLLQTFRPEFLQQDGAQLHAEFMQASTKWFLAKAMGLNRLIKQVNLYANIPVSKEALPQHLTVLREYNAETAAVNTLLEKFGADLGMLYNGQNTDWQQIGWMATQAQAAAQALYEQSGSWVWLHSFCGKPEYRDMLQRIHHSFATFTAAKTAFDNLLCIRQEKCEHWLDGQLALCQNILTHADTLREWTAFAGIREEAVRTGLSNVVEGYLAGAAHDTILNSYRKTLLQGLISITIDGSDTLNRFSGAVFDRKIEQYQRMDQEWTRLSQQEIYCRLAAKVPDFTREAAHSSELGILQRCIRSGGRGTSIRKLFDQIPNLLPRLCPCMLMSPISAAQYLDPKRTPFDIIVFDEASQLPTCKAVGVLARGENAVIVGDPKQMPPTAFFATNTVDEENLEAEDLESILDDCLALNMPQSHLLWHYRSRHESLIAFSNSQFYENKLFTFPAVNDRESQVRLIHVDGVFQRGKNRTNQAEAEAVIAELKRRCHDPACAHRSVGVVTFNISQQNLIDDLLSEACAQDPELEKWAYESEEPVFIKNLENVQGDERDAILFSVGYGPDEHGKVYMNFGPLNRDGGWRRLNVAVSRARWEMLVFATLRPEQIDLNRTQAAGVAALRRFLEYAQGKPLALDAGVIRPTEQTGIAGAICAALKEQGYETDLSIGRSEYRIDIGVVDPDKPEQYLLGILLDGGSYEAARTTRDREIAQIGVLAGLGWNILRVWSMDWWDNPAKECKRILSRLNAIRTDTQKPEQPSVASAAPQPVVESRPPEPVQNAAAPAYRTAALSPTDISADVFTEPKYERTLRKKLLQIVNTEGPVSSRLLQRRVVQSCGITRAGSRIQSHLEQILQSLELPSTRQEDNVFYWRADQNPAEYLLFRVSAEGGDRRDPQDIAIQEVANAMCMVLHEQISMGQEDLLRETAKKLGYARLSGNTLSVLHSGLQYARETGMLTPDANGAYLLSPHGTARAEAIVQALHGK